MPVSDEKRVAKVMKERGDVDIKRLIRLVLDTPTLTSSKGPVMELDGKTSLEDFKGKNAMAGTRMIINMTAQAINGNVKAAEFLMKYGGFEPPKEERLTIELPTIVDDMSAPTETVLHQVDVKELQPMKKKNAYDDGIVVATVCEMVSAEEPEDPCPNP